MPFARWRLRQLCRQCLMASEQGFIEHVADQAGLGRDLSWRKMFGKYALDLDARVVALVCGSQLFMKPT